ncbi:hypothetical protein BUALT_Bualt17G0070000 [Buddleja alternifolia]|uniref:NAC domain-containing protein n=1 Tax=Buddleja alternifolia TaxID=168488 RepID=A0AAV6W6N0_9LAMI|nr:hypothetical protein BUALT_Bualt17G0070000 [Buddleja alternifolia]
MEERSMHEGEKIDEVMLPGFRFHPTDEELVGFYLRRKIQHKPLSIELIKQLDIYKYDPWDLPKLATTGEKEWYFYCPRDRKYRNSARPNRVTGAGFWKATGTDRPIYSSEGSKCIGLKKSLVFYKGRAAKGTKTDWMMHEFRLPSVSDSVSPNKRYLDKNIPANFTSSNITSMSNKTNPSLEFGFYNDIEQYSSNIPTNFLPICKQVYDQYQMENKPFPISFSNADNLLITPSYTISSTDQTSLKCPTNDASSLFLDMSTSVFGDFEKGSENNLDYLSAVLPENIMQENVGHGEDEIRSLMGFPYNLPINDAWKSNLVMWDSSPCPSELSTSYSTNKSCYT